MLARALAEAVFREVIAACDPAARVRAALAAPDLAGRLAGRRRLAFAAGKAALAMARGAGAVDDGLAVVPRGGAGPLPAGWRLCEASHPEPDAASVAAGRAVQALIARAVAGDAVLALISGGASSLIEAPLGTLDELVATARRLMAAGAPIAELNAVRRAVSAIKGGKLARGCAAPITTLAISDVIGDDLAVIGSGPTIPARDGDLARVIAPMVSAAAAAQHALAARGLPARIVGPITGEPAALAARLLADLRADALNASAGDPPDAPNASAVLIAWGEPTVALPADAGVGGRAQQLALELAAALRATRLAALVVGTDGIDGPPPPGRPSPAGAYVDGETWDAIAAAGVDPAAARRRCDAGPALAAAGALVVTGPSGINHADLVLLG